MGSWAYNSYFRKDDYDDDGNNNDNEEDYVFGEGSGYESESEDDDFDDGVGVNTGNEESSRKKKEDLRSRRSRRDWSEYNHRHRSNPHSPHHNHHHRRHDEAAAESASYKRGNGATNNDGGVGGKIMTSAIGAAVSAGISAGINAYNNNHTKAVSAQLVRNTRMERCRHEASRAMMDFLPTLKKAIMKETDISAEMEELKSIRILKNTREESNSGEEHRQGKQQQQEEKSGDSSVREREGELWNRIKNKSITRLVTTVYAHAIVFLVLTVQVNLLGGRLLKEEQEGGNFEQQHASSSSSPDESDRYRSSHKTVLAKTYHHIFAKGIPSLAEAVAKAVDDALQNWDVLGGDDASLDDVSSWMEMVRDVIEKRQQQKGCNNNNNSSSALVQFVIPDEEAEEEQSSDHDDELARYILDETYDLLESPTYANAERLCLDVTFTHLREEGYAKLFSPVQINIKRGDDDEEEEERIPLAKVITFLQKPTVATFYNAPSHKAEMEDWEGVFRMMEEPLPSAPNVYIPKFSHAVTELSYICFN